MTEVFFRGWGSWYQLNYSSSTVDLITKYYVSGVFRLTDADEIAYIHTGKLPQDVIRLLPSGTRPDCAFLRLVQSGMLFGRDLELEECVFDLNCNQGNDMVLVVAKPYTLPDAETVQNNGDTGALLSINDKRNKVAKDWLDKRKPDLDSMTSQQILDDLEAFNNEFKISSKGLFVSGGNDWLNRDHSVIPKRKAGCKSGK